MKETSITRIEHYFTLLLTNLNWENKILRFDQLIPIYKEESVSVEHIFLLLHKHGYIGSHKENIQLIQTNLQLNQPTSFNDLRFHVVVYKAELFIFMKQEVKEAHERNQLKLFNNGEQGQ